MLLLLLLLLWHCLRIQVSPASAAQILLLQPVWRGGVCM
jgi:hypothetical protein